MPTLKLAALAPVALLSCWASAESGIVLSPDTILHLSLDNQIRYDDNVTLTHDANDDTVFIFTPGAELIYNGGLSKASVNVMEQIFRYDDYDGLNDELFSVFGLYGFDGAITKVDAHANYQELSQGSLSVTNAEQTVRRDVTDAAIDALWLATEKTHLGAGLFYHATNYTSSAYADTYCYGAPFDVYYAVTPKVDLSAGYRYRRTIVDELPTATRSLDTRDHFFNIGARGEFTPKLKGQLRVGYGIRELDEVLAGEDGTKEQFSFMGTMTYVYSPKTSFDFEASNDFNNSALGTSQRVLALRAGGKWELTPDFTVGAGLSYEGTDYDSGRNDDFFVGDVSAVYAFSENFSVSASYVFRENWSTYQAKDFVGNVLTVGLRIRY